MGIKRSPDRSRRRKMPNVFNPSIIITLLSVLHSISALGYGRSNSDPVVIKKTIAERDDSILVVDLSDELNLSSRDDIKPNSLRAIIASGDAKSFLGLYPHNDRGSRNRYMNSASIYIVKPLSREEQCPNQQEDWLVALKRARDRASVDQPITPNDLLREGKIKECVKSAIINVIYKVDKEKSSTQLIVDLQITIKDVNTNPPVFVDEERTIKISESAEVGRTFKLNSANDADLPPNHIKRYYMKGKAQAKQYFSVETEENMLDGTLIPHLKLIKQLDREQKESFEFELIAEDGFTDSRLGRQSVAGKGSMVIKIKVLDENDNAPKFKEQKPVVQVSEMARVDTEVYTAIATDADGEMNNKISYWFWGVVLSLTSSCIKTSAF